MKEGILRKESNVANLDFKLKNLVSERNALQAEVKAFQREVALMHENGAKTQRDLELKLITNQKDLHRIEQRQQSELSRVLYDQTEHIKEVENECIMRFTGLERRALQLREIKDDLELKLNSLCEENLRKRMEQEEHLRSLLTGFLEDERSKHEGPLKKIEADIKTLEDTRDLLNRKNKEIRTDLTKKGKVIFEEIMQREKEVGGLRKEMNESHTNLCKFDVDLEKIRMGLIMKENEFYKTQEELHATGFSMDRFVELQREKVEQSKVEDMMKKRIWSESADHHHMKAMELEKLIKLREAENTHIKAEYEKLSNILQNNVSRVVVQTLHEFHNFLPTLINPEEFSDVALTTDPRPLE